MNFIFCPKYSDVNCGFEAIFLHCSILLFPINVKLKKKENAKSFNEGLVKYASGTTTDNWLFCIWD